MNACFRRVLGLVFSIPRQEIGSGKHLRNDLVGVEWDVERQLNQSVNLPGGPRPSTRGMRIVSTERTMQVHATSQCTVPDQ